MKTISKTLLIHPYETAREHDGRRDVDKEVISDVLEAERPEDDRCVDHEGKAVEKGDSVPLHRTGETAVK